MSRGKAIITALLGLILISNIVLVRAPEPSTKFWFFSENPCPDFFNPEPEGDDPGDPNYVGDDGCGEDEWIKEGVLENIKWTNYGEDTVGFSLWIGAKNSGSTAPKLVVSINGAAFDAIGTITVYGQTISTWETNPALFPISAHGISNSAEFYGFAEITLNDLPESDGALCNVEEIEVIVTLNDETTDLIKIHFDAYDSTSAGPYSHDATAAYCGEDEAEGKIIIRKEVEWGKVNNYQNPMIFEFDVSWSETNVFITEGTEQEFILPPGSYTIKEVNSGFTIKEIIIEEDGLIQPPSSDTAYVTLEEDETITVTYINTPPDFVIPETALGTMGILLILIAAVAMMRKGNLPIKL